jgi:hypothetical protein
MVLSEVDMKAEKKTPTEFADIFKQIIMDGSLYHDNFEHSIRFSIAQNSSRNATKVMRFLRSLFDRLFAERQIMLIIQQEQGETNHAFDAFLNGTNPNACFEFTSKLDPEWFFVEKQNIIYFISKKIVNINKIMESLYQEKAHATVYFADTENQKAMNIYDRRGCDIVVKNKADLREIYDEFSEWVFEYNRDEIRNKLGVL